MHWCAYNELCKIKKRTKRMSKIEIEKVFTPGSPADITYIKRPKAEKQINRALRNTGIQIIVYGHSGSGKTTLLFNLLKEQERKHIITRCTKGISIKNVLHDAFSQLGSFYIEQKSISEEKKVSSNFKFGIDFFSFGLAGENKQTTNLTNKRIVEIQKNPHLLAKLFGEANYIWVIEDFHKLEIEPKKELSQIMKVFMDVSNEYPNLKIIAIGAVDSARQVVHYDSEMDNRVSEVHVPLMTADQLYNIIHLGEGHLNIEFNDSVKDRIVAYSSGLASVTHTLCGLACENKKIFETQEKKGTISNGDLDYAVKEYVSEKSDSLKSIYEQATKEKTKRKIETPIVLIQAILKVDKDSFTVIEISEQLSKDFLGYKANNLRRYILEFTKAERGEILRYNQNADNFSFSNPFLRGYCYINLIKYPKSKKSLASRSNQDAVLLKEYLNDEFNKFLRELEYTEEDIIIEY